MTHLFSQFLRFRVSRFPRFLRERHARRLRGSLSAQQRQIVVIERNAHGINPGPKGLGPSWIKAHGRELKWTEISSFPRFSISVFLNFRETGALLKNLLAEKSITGLTDKVC